MRSDHVPKINTNHKLADMQHQKLQENTLQHNWASGSGRPAAGPAAGRMPLAPSAREPPPSLPATVCYSRFGEALKVRRQSYAVDFIVRFILHATLWKTLGHGPEPGSMYEPRATPPLAAQGRSSQHA